MNPGCINCQPKPQREQRYDTAHSLSSQSWAEKYRHRGHFVEHIIGRHSRSQADISTSWFIEGRAAENDVGVRLGYEHAPLTQRSHAAPSDETSAVLICAPRSDLSA